MSECERSEIRDRLPEYVHDTVGAAERASIEAHLAGCSSCRAEVALLRTMRQAMVRRTPAVDAARVVAAAVSASRTAPSKRAPRLDWYAVAAAAAVIVAVGTLGYFSGRGSTHRAAPSPVAVVPIAPAPAPAVAPEPVAPPQLGVAPAPAPAPMLSHASRGLSFGGGVEDLSATQVNSLMKELDKIAPALDDEPAQVIDLGSAS